MGAAKRKGTAWESAWCNYIREHHNPLAHRNVQMGAKDIGDVDGYYLHAAECKAEREIRLSEYVDQANQEAENAGKPFGAAIIKRRGKGVADAYVVRDVATDTRLMNRLQAAERIAECADPHIWDAWVQELNEQCPWPVRGGAQ